MAEESRTKKSMLEGRASWRFQEPWTLGLRAASKSEKVIFSDIASYNILFSCCELGAWKELTYLQHHGALETPFIGGRFALHSSMTAVRAVLSVTSQGNI